MDFQSFGRAGRPYWSLMGRSANWSKRAGRAGRTGPGHCYRLYSSALFNDRFDAFSEPEILRTPIEGVVLHMKAMNIDHIQRFPFPTRPEMGAIDTAESVWSLVPSTSGECDSSFVRRSCSWRWVRWIRKSAASPRWVATCLAFRCPLDLRK